MIDVVTRVKKPIFSDARGLFSKTFSDDVQLQYGESIDLSEVFYSISAKNVLRGMHYQKRPNDHVKLVSVIKGSVLDVVVNIDPDSPSCGDFEEFEIDEDSNFSILIPPGYAHGFLSTSSDSILLYHTSSSHSADSDTGVRWDSFGYSWPVENPILSERDQNLPKFGDNVW